MIFRDSHGLIVDSNGDAGDSARAAGIVDLFSNNQPTQSWIYVGSVTGLGVRHPYQAPWDNPKNFTRDQQICLMAGLWAARDATSKRLAKKMFWSSFRRGFFCQNIERDSDGSKKYLWPHEFYKDSRPTAVTKKLRFNFRTFKWEGVLASNVKGATLERRTLDWRDPLFIHHIGHLILCARIYWLYWALVLSWPVFAFSLLFASKDPKAEQNQVQCMVRVAGNWAVWLYKRMNPMWKIQTHNYWASRDQKEIS